MWLNQDKLIANLNCYFVFGFGNWDLIQVINAQILNKLFLQPMNMVKLLKQKRYIFVWKSIF